MSFRVWPTNRLPIGKGNIYEKIIQPYWIAAVRITERRTFITIEQICYKKRVLDPDVKLN